MMIDILFLAHGREEFTEASWNALVANTNWRSVNSITIYFDGRVKPNGEHMGFVNATSYTSRIPLEVRPRYAFSFRRLGGPVPVMSDYLTGRAWGGAITPAPLFAKIDNDVIVPPGWLEQCVTVMDALPVDLLGIEPPQSRTANPSTGKRGPEPDRAEPGFGIIGFEETEAVGGIGLFRRSAFAGRPLTSHSGGRGGFTDWQLRHPEVTKGWIVPPLKLFLLDRLPMAPWVTLSERYEAEGIQRKWTRYTEAEARELAGWWLDAQAR